MATSQTPIFDQLTAEQKFTPDRPPPPWNVAWAQDHLPAVKQRTRR